MDGAIGPFANTLALRARLAGDISFLSAVRGVKESLLGACAHGEIPFEKLVEELRPDRNLSYNPLCQVTFDMETPPAGTGFEQLHCRVQPISAGATRFDLSFRLHRTEGGLRVQAMYARDLFDAETIWRLLANFRTLLESAAVCPDACLADLPLLADGERQELLEEWNQTRSEYPKDRCVDELFEDQADSTPERVALIFGDRKLTYAELNDQADRLASNLRALGVGPEKLVGICLERSLEMIVAILGIWKAGGAYVPLDPSYPRDRLAFVLADAKPVALVTREEPQGHRAA